MLNGRCANCLRMSSAAARISARIVALAFAWGMAAASVARAGWSTTLLPLLAQAQKTAAPAPETPAAEGGTWAFVDWLIVVVLIGAAVFVICRSSRRN
jgi:hypothetical protein